MRRHRFAPGWSWLWAAVVLIGCKEEEPPPPQEGQPELAKGDACDPEVERVPPSEQGGTGGQQMLPPICAPGLACDPVDGSDEYVCGTAVEVRGRVTDSTDGTPIEGALVAALNESGEPVTDVVATDSCGDYALPVSVQRTADGEFADTPKWTLNVSAYDYLPFPADLRPALPIDIADAVADPEPPDADGEEEGEETYVSDVIDNAATSISLIPLSGDELGGAIISGTVADPSAAGMLVVAESGAEGAPFGIADASGHYTLFNVPDGEVTIRGYRRGIEVEPAVVMASGGVLEGVDLPVVSTTLDDLGTITGSLNIVNAPGDSQTSVVLVPISVYNSALERGPVPIGLRDPEPPMTPNVTGDFSFAGVPSGEYKLLVAFENDDLVRDPDEGIAGTAILEVALMTGQDVDLQDSFKVTEALAVIGPGPDAPEVVEADPTLVWADDSSEDGYDVVVFNALGELVWETQVPGVSGSDTVELDYGGPALMPGMYYQFRVTSFRTPPNDDPTYISRTEDLRGVFVHGEAEPQADCESETSGADTTDG